MPQVFKSSYMTNPGNLAPDNWLSNREQTLAGQFHQRTIAGDIWIESILWQHATRASTTFTVMLLKLDDPLLCFIATGSYSDCHDKVLTAAQATYTPRAQAA